MNTIEDQIQSSNLLKIKNSSNLNEFLKTISDLPYILQRKLYFYLNEK